MSTPKPTKSALRKYLSRKGRKRIEETEQKLSNLDDRYKLWVRDSTARYNPEAERAPYIVDVTPERTIEDIRREVTARSRIQQSADVSDSEEEDEIRKTAGIQLIYCGKVLEDGKKFKDYNFKRELWKWSKPYAGVIWISPFHVSKSLEVKREREAAMKKARKKAASGKK